MPRKRPLGWRVPLWFLVVCSAAFLGARTVTAERPSLTHLSVVLSGGAADAHRHHPGRGHPHDAPSSAAGGQPATACPSLCAPGNMRLGRFSPAIARGRRSDVRAAEGGLTPLRGGNPVCHRPPPAILRCPFRGCP